MDTVKSNNLSWYAGFFDGEGTITVKRYIRKSIIDYTIQVSCTQVDKPENAKLIESFKDMFGGHIYRYTQKPLNGDRINTIQWSATAHKCRDFLLMIKPYLRLKNRQCELAIEFTKGLNKRNDPTPLTKEERLRRAMLFDRMRNLNVKGKLRLQRLSEETAKADATV